jgi:Chaperone of endosialidase
MKTHIVKFSREWLPTTFASAMLLFVSSAAAQNVGIGVSNPQSKLSVNGTTSSGGLAIGDSTYTGTSGTVAPANGAIIQGSVGMGIKTPQVPLHVNGSIYVAPGGVTGNFWNGTANTDGTELDLFGLIGIQRAAGADLCLSKPPSYTNTWLIQFLINNTTIGTVSVGSGGTTVVYGTTSDARLKENIRPTAKGLNEVMKIQVRDYNFKSKPGQNDTGFIAQELYTVFPDVVTRGGEDAAKEPWTVDYGRVTPLLTKAIQQQQVEIEILKEQIGRQDVRLKAAETENTKLKARTSRLATLEHRTEVLEAENAKLTAIVSKVESLEQTVNGLRKKTASQPVAFNQ